MPISSLTGQYFGSLPGGPTQAGKGAFGAVPTVPSPTGTQTAAIQGNLANLGQLSGLTGGLNQLIAQQAQLPYNLNLPQYGQMVGQSSQNILSQLSGQVPQDVANQLQTMAAERGVSTGSIGSPNANAALLRSLGLTSLGLQQQGEQNLTAAIGRTPTGQQFNPQTFLTTPSQQQEAAYMANLYSAAPNPAAAANAAKRAGQEGLNTSIGGLAQPRGGVTMPGADFFGNVYNPGSEYGGTIVGTSLGWPGGAQSGQVISQPLANPGAGIALGGGGGPVTSQPWAGPGVPYSGIGGDITSTPWTGMQDWQAGMPYTPQPGDLSTRTGEYAGTDFTNNIAQLFAPTGLGADLYPAGSTWEDMFPTGADMFSDEGG